MKSILFILSIFLFSLGYSQIASFDSDTVCLGSHSNLFSTSSPSDSIISWEWDLDNDGDYIDASGPNINYLFPAFGSHVAGLKVTFNNSTVLFISKPVIVKQVLSPSFSWNQSCQGEEVTLVGGFTDVYNDPVVYTWDLNGDNVFEPGVDSIINHTFNDSGIQNIKLKLLTSQGCTSVLTDQVVVDPTPKADFIITKKCYGDSTLFSETSSITSGSIDAFYWDINNNGLYDDLSGGIVQNQYFTPGSYSVGLQVESDQGCLDDTLIYFSITPKPNASFIIDNTCQNALVGIDNLSDLDVGTISYSWSFGDGDSSVLELPMKTYVNPGNYDVQLTVSSNFFCSDSVQKSVTIYPSPNASFSAGNYCFGEQLELQNFSSSPQGLIEYYQWEFGDGQGSVSYNPVHEYGDTGNYNVRLIIENDFSCKDTTDQDVIVLPNPSISIYNHDLAWFCDLEGVTLSVFPENDEQVVWSNGGLTTTSYFDYGGLHHVMVYDENGCSTADSIFIEKIELPIVDAGIDFNVNAGETVFLNGSGTDNPEWIEGENISSVNNWKPTVTPEYSAEYILQATNSYGCFKKDSVYIGVDKSYVLDPTNLLSPNGDGNNDYWIVRNIEAYDDCEVVIFNRWGQEIHRSQPYENNWDGTFQGEKLPEGAYYYTIKCSGSVKIYTGDISLIRSDE